jgi:transcription antitermination protein NusB
LLVTVKTATLPKVLKNMITRRNVRIKVMQAMYKMVQTAPDDKQKFALQDIQQAFSKTKDLYFFVTKILVELTSYVEKDAKLKAGKHLPSVADLSINTKLASNTLILKIKESADYQTYNKAARFNNITDNDFFKKLYLDLIATTAYQEYINTSNIDIQQDKKILLFIVSDIIFPNEHFEDIMESYFNNWDDDNDMVRTLLIAQLNKPEKYSVEQLIGKEKNDFGLLLCKTFIEKVQYCEELFVPKLKNWDEGRIAVLDRIIITLGLCELLYFETIPAKVTINEYIDLAKEYSTKQSGQFINGILDGLHKELDAANKLNKKPLIKN